MKKYLEKSGKTEDEALAAALRELGLDRDDVSVEIVERAKSGFLGIGSSPAVVRVEYEVPDEEPAETPAPEKPKKAEAPAKAPAGPKYTEGVKADTESFLRGLLDRMGVKAEIEITERENGGLLLNLSGHHILRHQLRKLCQISVLIIRIFSVSRCDGYNSANRKCCDKTNYKYNVFFLHDRSSLCRF